MGNKKKKKNRYAKILIGSGTSIVIALIGAATVITQDQFGHQDDAAKNCSGVLIEAAKKHNELPEERVRYYDSSASDGSDICQVNKLLDELEQRAGASSGASGEVAPSKG